MAIGDSKFFSLSRFMSGGPLWQWSRDQSFIKSFINVLFNSDTPVWVDIHDLTKPYHDCPHLREVIDRKADMFANGQWKCVDIKDEKKEYPDDEGLVLLNNPNPMQTSEEFLKSWIHYKSIQANNFIRKIQGSKLVLPKALWHLPSEFMEIKYNGVTFFDQVEMSGIIENYILREQGVLRTFKPDEVIYKAENFSYAERKGLSKIPSLQFPISNLIAALKTNNIITVTQGVKGVWSNEAKDVTGTIRMTPKSKQKVEQAFETDRSIYGAGAKVEIVDTPVKWTPVGYPTKDLELSPQNEENFNTIIGSYGMRRELFPGSSATYENQKEAEKGVYHSTIQPEADSFAACMSKELGATAKGRKYILYYGWLPIMKEDALREEQAIKVKAEKNEILLEKGVINHQAFADDMGIPLTGDSKIIPRPSGIPSAPPANP